MMRSQEESRVPAVAVRSVSFSYPDLTGSDRKIEKEGRSGAFLHDEDDTCVLRDVSFEIAAGEIAVLTGFSGCGKSTLCNIIGGIIPNVIHGDLTGHVELFGKDTAGVPLYETAQTAGMVFQNVDLQMVCTTVEDELAFGLENLCVPPEEIRLRGDEMMDRMGLEKFRLRSPSSLSGGQKRLISIARVFLKNPPILILDEPARHLDENGRKIVRETVLSLHRAGRTVIMVEHDLSLVDYAHRWIVIRDGKVAEDAPPQYFREHPEILERLELR